MRSLPLRRLAPVALALLLAACGSDGPSQPAGVLAVSLGNPTMSITAGASATTTVNVARGGSFTGPVELDVQAPSWVAASFAPATLPTGTTSSVLTLTVVAGKTPETATVTVRARGTGVSDASAPITVTVLAAPAYALNIAAPPGGSSLPQGGRVTVGAIIAREPGFTGPVEVSVEGLPAGVTAPSVTIPSSASTVGLTFNAAQTAALGTSTVTVRARSAGLPDRTATLPITVTPPAPITVVVSPTAASLPVGRQGQMQVTVTGTTNTAVIWRSSAPSIATVSGTGLVTGVSLGQATITAISVADTTKRASGVITIIANPADSVAVLTSGVPLTGLSGAIDSEKAYRITVPAGATRLEIRTSGGTGDLDMYVRRGAIPAPGAPIDCESEGETNAELCVIQNPAPGDWFILLYGFEAYSGVTLVATVSGGGTVPASGYTLSVSPPLVSVAPGGGASIVVTATRASGFTGTITFSQSGLPTGVSINIGPAVLSGTATTSTINLTANQGVTPGTYTVVIRGSSPGLADVTANIFLTVRSAVAGAMVAPLTDTPTGWTRWASGTRGKP